MFEPKYFVFDMKIAALAITIYRLSDKSPEPRR